MFFQTPLQHHPSIFLQALKAQVLQPHMDVLDFGCGTGLLAMGIADSVATVLGVDNSSGMIQV